MNMYKALAEIEKLEEEKKDLEKQRDRCLVIALKWCDRTHHDWDELLKHADK